MFARPYNWLYSCRRTRLCVDAAIAIVFRYIVSLEFSDADFCEQSIVNTFDTDDKWIRKALRVGSYCKSLMGSAMITIDSRVQSTKNLSLSEGSTIYLFSFFIFAIMSSLRAAATLLLSLNVCKGTLSSI